MQSFAFRWALSGFLPDADKKKLSRIAAAYNPGVIKQLKRLAFVMEDDRVMSKVVKLLSDSKKEDKNV
jgi:hypothetical protein